MTLIYPGSFDPVTLGHIDIAMRGAKIATQLIVAVLHNPGKQSLFSVEERVAFLQGALGSMNNIEITYSGGMLVELAAQKGATAILRGVRGISDLENETNAAAYNKLLSSNEIETILLPASQAHSHISSSAVREIASLIYSNNLCDSVLATMVGANVQEALRRKYQ